jgi:hypothetical protein
MGNVQPNLGEARRQQAEYDRSRQPSAQTSRPPCSPSGYKHNCFGTATDYFGYKYVGEYQDNKRSGLGATILPNGEQYVGEYKDDRRNGHGIEYRGSGVVSRAGLWVNDNLVQPFSLDTNQFPFNAAEAAQQRQRELEKKLHAESRKRQHQVPDAGAARRQSEYDRDRAEPVRLSNEGKQCAGYGFVSGTTPFAQCVMQIDIAQRAALEKRQQAERLRSQRYSQCKLEEVQIWLEPGGGDFFQTATRVQRRFESCMAGLPPPPSIDVLCNRVGRDQISCSSR